MINNKGSQGAITVPVILFLKKKDTSKANWACENLIKQAMMYVVAMLFSPPIYLIFYGTTMLNKCIKMYHN
jgi:uncharacterized membrane protein